MTFREVPGQARGLIRGAYHGTLRVVMIRFYCVTYGPAAEDGLRYLEGLQQAGAQVRALAIGHMALAGNPRWWAQREAFTRELTKPYANVVCAPLGLLLGGTLTSRQLAQLSQAIPGLGHLPADEEVYRPQTAFQGLFTVGCRNVAIAIVPAEGTPAQEEIYALARYERVYCPTYAQALVLRMHGIEAQALGPTPVELNPLVEDLCGSGTTATGLNSPASAAPPATTSPPSPPPAPRSTSSPGLAIAPARSPATSTPTSSRWRTTIAWLRRTWRSFTRRRPG